MQELVKWLPGALDRLQGWKRLVQLAMNVMVVLTLLLILGVDLGKLTGGTIAPVVAWWWAGLMAIALVAIEARLSNAQEERRRASEAYLDVGPLIRDTTRPPAPPGKAP